MARRWPDFGRAYREARLRNGAYSQERLAEAVGVTRRHLIRIENGEHRPRPHLRDRIAAVLGIDPSQLPAAEVEIPLWQRGRQDG